MSTIKLPKSCPDQLVLIIRALVKNLHNRFDMAPEIIEGWLSRPDFLEWVLKKHRQMEKELLGNLMNQPKILELMEIYHSQQPMDILIKNLGWEKEECGFLINKYDNGYYQYCNLTRYEHLSREMQKENLKNENLKKENPSQSNSVESLDGDHSFIRKTYQQMIDEKIFNFKYQAYQEFMDRVLKVILAHFNQILNREYRIYRYCYQDQKYKTLLNWLKKNPKVFRAKMGLTLTQEKPEVFLDIYVPINGEITLPRQKPVAVFD